MYNELILELESDVVTAQRTYFNRTEKNALKTENKAAAHYGPDRVIQWK